MKKQLNDSQLNMWRATIALMLADGVKHTDEIQFFTETFGRLPLSEQQQKTLEEDIQHPKQVADFFDKITEPKDRSQFIYFARLLFWSDGDFSAQEEKILNSLGEQVMSRVDLGKVMQQVDDVAKKEMANSQKRPWRERFADAIIFWEDL